MIGRYEVLRHHDGGSSEGTGSEAVRSATTEPKRLGREGMEDLIMTLSSPKRLEIDKRVAPRAALLSGLILALGLSANGAAQAALHSSTNFAIESETFASGGGQASSTGYSLSGTLGQSSALGGGASASYALLPGYQATVDIDRDGYPDHLDAFPSDPSEWVDTDGDSIGNNADTDDDNDGMPDVYEGSFVGLDPLVDDAAGDLDSDGFTNLEEYIAGTDPTVDSSRPIQMVDFNYDFQSDILWRHDTDGRVVTWQMDGFIKEATAKIGQPALFWYVAGVGDFNDDGNADILWHSSTSGDVVIWMMDGFVQLSTGKIGNVSSAWSVSGLADLDGDGNLDIVWRNNNTGNVVLWQMSGFTKLATGSVGLVSTTWQIVGLADFTNDNKSDILWRNAVTGTNVVWEMDGFTKVVGISIGTVATHWRIAGLADFNGASQMDILWRDTNTGTVVIWQMSGLGKEATASVGTPSLSWQIVRLGDYTGGGQADILWRNLGTGGTVIWQMNGFVREDAQLFANLTGWTVQ
jgi:hypothetical protein